MASNWCVIYTDHREGESYMNGPFTDYDLAKAWAKRFAADKAAEYAMEVHGEDDYFYILVEGDDAELILEVNVEIMIPPYPEN